MKLEVMFTMMCRGVAYKTYDYMSDVKVTESRLNKCFDMWAPHVAPGHLGHLHDVMFVIQNYKNNICILISECLHTNSGNQNASQCK